MLGSGALERAGPRGPGWAGAQLLLGGREEQLRGAELGSTGEGAAGGAGLGLLERKVCAELCQGCTGDSGSGGALSVSSRRKGVSEGAVGVLGVVVKNCGVSCNTGERAEVMVGKMEPGTWSVYSIRVRFLDASGRHFCKELRNAVCKEDLAYLERVGRFKEHFRSRREKRCR